MDIDVLPASVNFRCLVLSCLIHRHLQVKYFIATYLIHSEIDYCNSLLRNLPAIQTNHLHLDLNSAARAVTFIHANFLKFYLWCLLSSVYFKLNGILMISLFLIYPVPMACFIVFHKQHLLLPQTRLQRLVSGGAPCTPWFLFAPPLVSARGSLERRFLPQWGLGKSPKHLARSVGAF